MKCIIIIYLVSDLFLVCSIKVGDIKAMLEFPNTGGIILNVAAGFVGFCGTFPFMRSKLISSCTDILNFLEIHIFLHNCWYKEKLVHDLKCDHEVEMTKKSPSVN